MDDKETIIDKYKFYKKNTKSLVIDIKTSMKRIKNKKSKENMVELFKIVRLSGLLQQNINYMKLYIPLLKNQ